MWRGPQATSGTEARTRIVSNAGKLETFGPLKQILLLLPLWVAHVCGAADLAVQVAEPALWSAVLKSVGLEATLHENRFSIVVGNSPAGRKLGFRPTAAKVRVAQIADARAPKLDIYWQEPLELPVFDLPPGARIFAQEKRTGAPLVAGLKQAKGAVLWVAAAPGTKGYERFPLLDSRAGRSGTESATTQRTHLGLFRLLLPDPCRSRLPGRTMARSRYCGAARQRLAFP